MERERQPAGRAPASPGTRWKSLTIPEPLYALLSDVAAREGVSVCLKARKLLEAALSASQAPSR